MFKPIRIKITCRENKEQHDAIATTLGTQKSTAEAESKSEQEHKKVNNAKNISNNRTSNTSGCHFTKAFRR